MYRGGLLPSGGCCTADAIDLAFLLPLRAFVGKMPVHVVSDEITYLDMADARIMLQVPPIMGGFLLLENVGRFLFVFCFNHNLSII